MNEKVKEFLEAKREEEKKKFQEEKRKTMLDLGLYEKVYAPVTGYGHIKDESTIVKFPITNNNIKIGDTVKITRNEEKVEVILDKIESNYNQEYPFYEWDHTCSINRYYKKTLLEVTDEEYEEIKKYSQKRYTSTNNPVATALTVIAWIVFIGGFIIGIASANVEVIKGVYYTYTTTEFSLTIALTYWCIALISGTFLLGFAEIIKLLDDIKKK